MARAPPPVKVGGRETTSTDNLLASLADGGTPATIATSVPSLAKPLAIPSTCSTSPPFWDKSAEVTYNSFTVRRAQE